MTSTCLTYQVTEQFGVQFDSLDCYGLTAELLYVMFDRNARWGSAANHGVARHRMQLVGAVPVYSAEPEASRDIRPDQLLLQMAAAQIGRPSTYARVLRRLDEKELLLFPHGDGPVRLSPDLRIPADERAGPEDLQAQLLARLFDLDYSGAAAALARMSTVLGTTGLPAQETATLAAWHRAAEGAMRTDGFLAAELARMSHVRAALGPAGVMFHVQQSADLRVHIVSGAIDPDIIRPTPLRNLSSVCYSSRPASAAQ